MNPLLCFLFKKTLRLVLLPLLLRLLDQATTWLNTKFVKFLEGECHAKANSNEPEKK
jgi:hypothetical protein